MIQSQKKRITNFGGNVSFTPKHFYTPQNEKEVLWILNKHATGKIRVIASLHAWSDIVQSEDVIVDMRHLNNVEIEKTNNGEVWTTAGGGCDLQRLLDTIHRQTDATLPTMGGIKKQTIAGVISTATHGSGKPSLSHFMKEIRVAAYDKTGRAKIYTWKNGPELRAARCAIGCMGIILSVKFRCVPKYYVEETTRKLKTLRDVLAKEQRFPLQQFILIPHFWKYFAYQRRVVAKQPPMWRTYWHRVYNFFFVDILLHLVLKVLLWIAASKKGSSRLIYRFYTNVLPLSMRQMGPAVDFSEHAITLHHHLFKHLEMEIFIPAHNIYKAANMVEHVVSMFAGTAKTLSDDVTAELKKNRLFEQLVKNAGSYTHHYPIFFRHILSDDTLIAMTNGSESYYSISFFTYLSPNRREYFYTMVDFIAHCLTRLYDARLHWGKYYPLEYKDIKHLYPHLEEFKQICKTVDPNGTFSNAYTKRVLGFN